MNRMTSLLIVLTALSLLGMSCGVPETGVPLPPSTSDTAPDAQAELIVRLAQVTDTHAIDTESPARFTEAYFATSSAWRPFEAYSMQLLDGVIRAANRIHASGRTIDLLLHTGDACDNSQTNERDWFLTIMDGGEINPLSGIDDRAAADKPARLLDPYAAFEAQGLYRKGRHGELESIPWYFTIGNHDHYAVGVLAFFENAAGRRTAPAPLPNRPGVLLPTTLDPTSAWAAGRVTPADPGPPEIFEWPLYVEPRADREYFEKSELAAALDGTATAPAGHGLSGRAADGYWYSTLLKPGLRLIGLDTTDRLYPLATAFYDQGALSRRQLDFLRAELDRAAAHDELVIVAAHHPSSSLLKSAGSEVDGTELRAMLNEYPGVVLYVTGHMHRNRVTDQGGYLEIETCSTLDLPQEGRLIEVWRDPAENRIVISYEMFSHLDDTLPPLGADPLRELREQARAIAMGDKGAAARQKCFDPTGADPRGEASDRQGVFRRPAR
jgi:3',5'-cyclic AMP phosphodiesterase CpdA